MARNFEIINRLQTHVEPELFARPGAYDGRKNIFMAFELPFGDTGAREVGPLSPRSSSLLTRFMCPVCGPHGSPAIAG